MFRSHITQIMQNYFDHSDVRSRENPYAIEAQILNIAASELEDLTLRITRESSLTLQTVPTNIDNGGTYYSGRIPSELVTSDTQTTLNSVVGTKDSVDTILLPYEDTLPTPAAIEVDSTRDAVPMTDPILFTVTGVGDDREQSYATQYATPGAMPIPNTLTLWLDQLGLNQPSVIVTIVGETFPRPAWLSERTKTTEVMTLSSEGYAVTRNRWATIDQIAVRNLPTGMRLRGWGIPFNLPAVPDVARPYTHPAYRDRLFDRYWVISNDNNRFEEDYLAVGFTGLEMLTLRPLTESLMDIAVEPNTYGLFMASKTTLYYTDRREVCPKLVGTGLATEPLYGLQVVIDPTASGSNPYVLLSGAPYANSGSIVQYRYTFSSPANIESCILPDGSVIDKTADAGWRGGPPQQVKIPLLMTGSYMFILECQDNNGVVTHDSVPFESQAFSPEVSIDITTMFDDVAGMAFDSYGTLWVWTGSFALPIKIRYNGYVIDAPNKTIYVTDAFDTLTIS